MIGYGFGLVLGYALPEIFAIFVLVDVVAACAAAGLVRVGEWWGQP